MVHLGFAADQPIAASLAAESAGWSTGYGELAVDLSLTVLLALVVRLLSLPLLRRAQLEARRRAVASVSGSAPVEAGAVAAEVAACMVFAAGFVAAASAVPNYGFELLRGSLVFADSQHMAMDLGLTVGGAELRVLIIGAVPLAAWLLLAHLSRRALLSVGMPAAVAADGRVRRRNLLRLGLFAVAGVLVLPMGVLAAGAVFQAVALVSARRLPAPTAPTWPTAGFAFPPQTGAAPGAFAHSPANPYVAAPGPDPFFAAPARDAAAPAAPPATAPATAYAPAYTPAAPGPVRVPHQPLNGHEPRGIGGYRLLGRIGAGGMGTVYLAQREGAATQVALKTINLDLLDDPDLLRRFQRESEVLAMVPGAYTARVLDTGVDAGRPFLAMELLDGRPLDAHLRELGPLRSPEALRALALALAVALSGVHRLGLVHRDLKPANIMLTSAGPRLLDFGIAALVDGTRLTMTGANPGTLTYMAPEQFGEERVGTAADVWAWACCVVCAAHGASPFAATSTGGVIRRIVDTGPEPSALAAVRALDPALAAAVTRALAPDPAARPADGAALLALLTDAPQSDLREEITCGWNTLRL
ncbi:serine/threonine-protein kinase [Kitasatospora phosalacinea]|uniref:serine/threonine-protein kinase n=1 Tax=Kitasatospora phosalacinea TaxID=2065 RepID=UPI00068C9ADB|nr:serine/threonine-protein kinase [Kitasatospora phosalacinea]